MTEVDKVIATKPTPEMTLASLPSDLVAKLDAAAQASFKEAAAPGAIVGVRSPQGTWIKAYGVANPSGVTRPPVGPPMTADMHTRIGSVTKYYDTNIDTTVAVQTNSDIPSGDCPPEAATLTDNPTQPVCSSPATRMFVALSTALGNTFTPA